MTRKKKRVRLTEAEWNVVFLARCKSKQGQPLTADERSLVDAAYDEDLARYRAMEPDVFDATVPLGSNVKWPR